MKIERMILPPSGFVPNNQNLPVVLYIGALPGGGSDQFEALFEKNGWTGIWTNGVFTYQHYHSGAHEVLGVSRGAATLIIGGPDGRAIAVNEGDGLLLPAGTGHMNVQSSSDFEVVGAYPKGQHADIETLSPSHAMLALINSLPLPATDPIQGAW
ncbi:cupin [Rhizobium sp. Root708]|uniref:cupin n=1 Tax=Rhizobium sp. Root708 TaxID=1736592 RepID=UPI0006F30F03|nr:cupin [Rhizobium sp. Root708]KRB49278.1 cupin [Rhizobium sp. Root708]